MNKAKGFYNWLLIVLFAGIISIVFLNDIFLFSKSGMASQSENRNLARKPMFDIGLLDPFPKKYSNYFNDHFPFRTELGMLNTLICFFVFHQSPLPGQVEVGKHGWLFFDQKESDVYQGRLKLYESQVNSLANKLKSRALEYKKLGVKFYVAFAPMKHEIYTEELPVDLRRTPGGTITDQVVRAIENDTVIRFIDLRSTLLKAKTTDRIFYMTDNHWNWLGAYYAYAAIMRAISRDFKNCRTLSKDEITFSRITEPPGNLARMIGLTDFLKETDFYPKVKAGRAKQMKPELARPPWAAQIDNYEILWVTGDTTLPTALIIRDSFADSMMPYLNESFNQCTYIFDGWQYLDNIEIVRKKKPQVVILLVFEPHICHIQRIW